MQCTQCASEIELLIEVLHGSYAQLCSSCSGEQQEKIKGGYRLWVLLPDGTRTQERVWCPGCRNFRCKKGRVNYEQCEFCQRLIDDLKEMTEWPDGCIEFLDSSVWYPECTQCYRGTSAHFNGGSIPCARCREQHEQWLNQYARKDIRYHVITAYPFLDVVYFTDEKKPGMGKQWMKRTGKMDLLASTTEFALRHLPEPKRASVTVISTALNIISGKRDRIGIHGEWSITFSSLGAAQEWIYQRMGNDFKNFWL